MFENNTEKKLNIEILSHRKFLKIMGLYTWRKIIEN